MYTPTEDKGFDTKYNRVEAWCVTLKEHRLKVFEKRMLRIIYGRKGMKWQEAGENWVLSSTIYTLY
jgi:hypothetical protein